MWTDDTPGIDITSTFMGVTAPLTDLYAAIHSRGWEVTKVKPTKTGYEAEARNPYNGQKVKKVGGTAETAVAALLMALTRLDFIRTYTSAWKETWLDRLAEIALAYSKAPVYDPKAVPCWHELAQDCKRRVETLHGQLEIEVVDNPQPYDSPEDLFEDVKNKGHLCVSRANSQHPVWSSEQVVDFRIVHQVLGHVAAGGAFDWHGENQATAQHMPLLSPTAQKALFVESIGRTAYVTYMPGIPAEQKIAFLDDVFTYGDQAKENGPDHQGVHPSQALAPVETPQIPRQGSVDHESGMTLPQELREWKDLQSSFAELAQDEYEEDYPADAPHPTVLHSFPDGWTVQHHPSQASAQTVGGFMRNCWQDRQNAWQAAPGYKRAQFAALHDEHGLPRAAFYWHPQRRRITAPLGMRNQSLTPELEAKLEQFRHGAPDQSASVKTGATLDPNAGWESGHAPTPRSEDPESGAAYTDWGDPIGWDRTNADSLSAKDMIHRLRSGWSQLTHPDGMPNRPMMKKAVVNAFLATLMSPRKSDKWGAIHYQHLADTAHLTNDPHELHVLLEQRRVAWNTARKIPHNAHKPHYEAERDYARYLQTKHPEWTHEESVERAEHFARILLDDEKGKVAADLDTREVGLDDDKKTTTSQIEIQAAKGVKKHLEAVMKPAFDPDTDFSHEHAQRYTAFDPPALVCPTCDGKKGEYHPEVRMWIKCRGCNGAGRLPVGGDGAAIENHMHYPLDLDHPEIPDGMPRHQGKGNEVDPSVGEMFDGKVDPEIMGAYSSWMGEHLKSVAAVSKRSDEILDAALKDMHDHKGAGHHFRSSVLRMGLPGITPRNTSFAWTLLQPSTSQLSAIDAHALDALGHEPGDSNNRDHFRMERELIARRDAAGYGHVPLGAFGLALADHKRGHDTHNDPTHLRVLNPLDHNLIDWNARGTAPKATKWKNAAPPWWKATDAAAAEVAQGFNDTLGLTHPSHDYPWREKPVYAPHTASEDDPEVHVSWAVPTAVRNEISNWATGMDWPEGTELEDPVDYHVTTAYAEHGHNNRAIHKWVREHKSTGLHFKATAVHEFGEGDEKAIVILLECPEATVYAEKLMSFMEEEGIEVSRHDGYKAHLTVAYGPGKPEDAKLDLTFTGEGVSVSKPRPPEEKTSALGDYAPSFSHEDGTDDVGAPGMTHMQLLREYYPLTTEELWAMPGLDVRKTR